LVRTKIAVIMKLRLRNCPDHEPRFMIGAIEGAMEGNGTGNLERVQAGMV